MKLKNNRGYLKYRPLASGKQDNIPLNQYPRIWETNAKPHQMYEKFLSLEKYQLIELPKWKFTGSVNDEKQWT